MLSQGNDIKIQVNDCSLVYDDKGIGNNPLIFIHAFPLTKSMWKYQLDEFAMEQRTITVDLRGFGESTRGYEHLSINLFADDLIALMDRLAITSAIIAGLSMGGYIALNAIQRFPERFNGLILCDTQCIADTDEVKKSRYKNIDVIKEGKFDVFANAMAEKLVCSYTKENNPSLVNTLKETILKQEAEVVSSTLEALAERWETCTGLESIKVPTLIICGKDDAIIPVERHEFLNKNINNSSLVIIDKAGHLPPLEQPDEFNSPIRAFLAKNYT